MCMEALHVGFTFVRHWDIVNLCHSVLQKVKERRGEKEKDVGGKKVRCLIQEKQAVEEIEQRHRTLCKVIRAMLIHLSFIQIDWVSYIGCMPPCHIVLQATVTGHSSGTKWITNTLAAQCVKFDTR